jgi:hypothetical protein
VCVSQDSACGISLVASAEGAAAAHFHVNVSVSGLPGVDPSNTVFNCTGGDRGGFRVEVPDDDDDTTADSAVPSGLVFTVARITIARASFPAGRGGGAFAAGAGATLAATDVVFTECVSGRAGGGISVERAASLVLNRVSIDACTAGSDNTGSDMRGGGAYVDGEGTHATFDDVAVTGCALQTIGKGGGVNVDAGAELVMRSTRVEQNTAFMAGGVFVGLGSKVTMENGSRVEMNVATYAAGVGVFGSSEVSGAFYTLVPIRPRSRGERRSIYTVLREPRMRGLCPAFFFVLPTVSIPAYDTFQLQLTPLNSTPTLLAIGGSFYASGDVSIADNVASEWGGGLIVYYKANATLDANTTVTRNVAKIGAGAEVYSGATLLARETSFNANRASESAGGVNVAPGATARFARVIIANNVASSDAGGVLVGAGATFELENGTIRGNRGDSGDGGGVKCEGGIVRAYNADVAENKCAALGGGVFLSRGSEATFARGSKIRTNVVRGVETCGGAVGSSVSGGGGVALVPPDDLASNATSFRLSDSEITGNVAPVGGGVFIHRDGSLLTAQNVLVTFADASRVRGNRALVGDGGGTYAAAGVVTIADKAVIEENEARGSGGGVFTTEHAGLVITGGVSGSDASPSIVGNVAGGFGGGVAFSGARLSVSDGVLIERNTALHGGGVAIALDPATALAAHAAGLVPHPSFSLTDGVIFRGNVAARRGGALYVSAPLELGVFSRLVFDVSHAAAGEHAYWSRAASSEKAFECDRCQARERAGDPMAPFFEEGRHQVGAATEALAATLADADADPTVGSAANDGDERFFESGAVAPVIEARLVDHYGRVASTEENVTCRIEARATNPASANSTTIDGDALELAGVVRNTSVAGVLRFAALIPRGRLGSAREASVECERAEEDADASPMNAIVRAPLARASIAASRFQLTFRTCFPGHEPVFTSLDASGARVARSCVECEGRSYNFDGLACRPCPLGGDCRGGDDLRALSGWHRATPDAEALFACPLRGACEPGSATGDAACAPKYVGPVCAVCAKGHRRRGFECVPCDGATTLATSALGLICLLGFVVYIFTLPAKTDEEPINSCFFNSLLFIAQSVGLLKDYDVRLPPGADRVVDALNLGAFYTLVPIRPRSRGERRSLRTLSRASLRPSLAFNPRPRRLSTPSNAYELHPDIALYATTLSQFQPRRARARVRRHVGKLLPKVPRRRRDAAGDRGDVRFSALRRGVREGSMLSVVQRLEPAPDGRGRIRGREAPVLAQRRLAPHHVLLGRHEDDNACVQRAEAGRRVIPAIRLRRTRWGRETRSVCHVRVFRPRRVPGWHPARVRVRPLARQLGRPRVSSEIWVPVQDVQAIVCGVGAHGDTHEVDPRRHPGLRHGTTPSGPRNRRDRVRLRLGHWFCHGVPGHDLTDRTHRVLNRNPLVPTAQSAGTHLTASHRRRRRHGMGPRDR